MSGNQPTQPKSTRLLHWQSGPILYVINLAPINAVLVKPLLIVVQSVKQPIGSIIKKNVLDT